MRASVFIFGILLAANCAEQIFYNERQQYESSKFPFHVYELCQPLVDGFKNASLAFSQCFFKEAIPPQVCVGCGDKYVELLDAYDSIINNDNVTVLGHKCSEVIISSYMISFVEHAMNSHRFLWERSYCQKCVTLKMHDGHHTWNMTEEYENFQNHIEDFRRCLRANNSMSEQWPSDSDFLCNNCSSHYMALYDYYWNKFIYPDDAPYCLDIESSMNDTIHLWRDILNCTTPKYPTMLEQAAGTLAITIALILLTLLFYVGNYVQGERLMKEFMKYSQSQDPRRMREGSTASVGGVQSTNRIRTLSPEELAVSDLYATTQANGPTLQSMRLQRQRIAEAEETVSVTSSNPATVHL